MATIITLDIKIHSGAWTLYFHAQEETKWGINTFTKLGTMTTWRELWALFNTLEVDSLSKGMFFLMRSSVAPLWENHQNIRGGGYSFRISKEKAGETFMTYAIAMMISGLCKDSKNQLNGLSISPKKGFSIVKIWNTDAKNYNRPMDMNTLVKGINTDDVLYMPFVQKIM